jgi:hypothetical protein
MTDDQMTRCIMALARALGSVPVNIPDSMLYQSTIIGLKSGNPAMMQGRDAINSILHQFFRDSNKDMEVAVRDLVNSVAATNQPKRFILPVVSGPGVGRWECIVKRVDTAKETPAFIVPPKSGLVN